MGKATQKTYFLLCPSEGLVKIGQSISPMRRLTQLRLMNAAPVEALTITLTPEQELHSRFAHLRHHGEWFSIAEEMVTYLYDRMETVAALRMSQVIEDRKNINGQEATPRDSSF